MVTSTSIHDPELHNSAWGATTYRNFFQGENGRLVMNTQRISCQWCGAEYLWCCWDSDGMFDAFDGQIEATIISISMVLFIHRGITSQLWMLVVMNKAFINHHNQLYGDRCLGKDCDFTESVSQV